jgi:hypothetical protein
MSRPWRRTSVAADVPNDLRANFEELGETVVAHIIGTPYSHATGQTPSVPTWAAKDDTRQLASAWLREKQNRAKRRVWIGQAIGWGLSLIVIGIAAYNLHLTLTADRPTLVITSARLYINPASVPSQLVQLDWRNNGKRSVLRGTVTLFSVSEDGGNQLAKYGLKEITLSAPDPSTTILPMAGAYIEIPVDMEKFLGLFLACVKYHDDTNTSYKQKFLLQRGVLYASVFTHLEEIPSKHRTCPR